MRPIPTIATDFVKKAEACVLTAYQDSAGVWTIGCGHTGPEVVSGLVITQAQADLYLLQDLAAAGRRLAAVVSDIEIRQLYDHEYAALLSFVFNVGADPKWTIWKLINAGQLGGVPAQIKRFDKAKINGKLVDVPGLDHRRLAEVTLWNTPDVAAAVAVISVAPTPAPPSSQTRAADTPPAPAPVKPLSQSKSFVSSAATATVAGVSAIMPVVQEVQHGLHQASDAIQPYADAVPLVAKVQQALMMTLAIMALMTVGLLWLKHSQAKAA